MPAGELIAVCGAVALIYPAVYGFEAAWQRLPVAPTPAAFVAALLGHRQLAGVIYVPGHEQNIAQYYLQRA